MALQSQPISQSHQGATQYSIAYSFKSGYTYKIKIYGKAVLGGSKASYPSVAIYWSTSNGGTNTSTNCSGPADVSGGFDANYGHGTMGSSYAWGSNLLNGVADQNYSYLFVAAVPAQATYRDDQTVSTTYIQKIEITETAPPPPTAVFTISPTSTVYVPCKSSITQDFTVTNVNNVPGVTYRWNLGANNGWIYGGIDAPSVPFIAPATISLTSSSSATTVSNVTVTPLVNGVPQNLLTVEVRPQTFTVGITGGSSTICDGTSSPYYLYNAPANSSVYWGTTTVLPNYGASVVSVNSPYSTSSTTLTKINSGVVNLTVSVTNSCYQNATATRQNILVGGYSSTELLSGYTLAYPPCYTQGCTPSAVSNQLNTSGPYGTTVYTGTAYTNCTNSLYLYNSGISSGTWSIVSGSVASWSNSGGNYLQFYPNGGPGDYVRFRLTVNTSCGTVYYDIDFYPTQYNYSGYYLLAPNPATSELTVSVDESQLQKMNVIKSSDQDIREVVVIDKMGQTKYRQTAGKGTRQMRINVSNLPTGYYVIRVYNAKDWKSLPFIKQ